MREKTVKKLLDRLYWYAIALLPVIIYLIYAISVPNNATSIDTFADIFNSLGFYNGNIVTTALVQLFGETGVIPFFEDTSLVIYILSYYVLAEVVHLAIDFLLFLPRMTHKFMEDFVDKE